MLHAGWLTFQEAVGGFAIGSGLGILVALALARWRFVGRAMMPYAIAANAVPIIAFAPIANAWFGDFSKASKIAIAAVLCFFPVMVNTLRGLTSVKPQSLELMRSYAATEPEIDFYQGTLLTSNVLEAMRRTGLRRILYASGSGVYGDLGEVEANEDYGPLLPPSACSSGSFCAGSHRHRNDERSILTLVTTGKGSG